MTPKVTILIAHRNYQEYLEGCLRSAMGQMYPSFRICLVDDCSDDRQSVIDIFNKIVPQNQGHSLIILDKSCGPSMARNIGIEHTIDGTDFYCILDADDEMYPVKLATMVQAIMQSPDEIGVVYADTDNLNTETGLRTREFRPSYTLERLQRDCIVHSGALINKHALNDVKDENGYFDQTLRTCEDYDLWLRISKRWMIIHLAEALTLIRIQPKNSTATVDKATWEKNYRRVKEKYFNA